MKSVSRLFLAGILLSSIGFAGCGGGGGGGESTDEETAGAGAPPQSGSGSAERQFTADCGTPSDGVLLNPVDSSQTLFAAQVSVIDSNVVALELPGGPLAIKLLGLQPAGRTRDSSIAHLNSVLAGGAYFIPGSAGCSVAIGAGQGTTGQVFTASGESLSESLIRSGFSGEVDTGGSCGEPLVAACYTALRETSTPKTAGELKRFLWKPKAESEYNKGSAVIHTDPCNATVYVNSVELRDYGPANGRCNTSRTFKPGCAWGQDIVVEVIDNETGYPYTDNGRPYVLVPNGCNRFEFNR